MNAQITKDILSGKEQGEKREIVLLNAGAALYIGGKADRFRVASPWLHRRLIQERQRKCLQNL